LNNLEANGGQVTQLLSLDNTHLNFLAFMTSWQQDNSVAGVMVFDPRFGTGKFYNLRGPERAMATKTAAANAIVQATHRWGYGVEDLTLHTIYGVPTWEGVLTMPAFDNRGKPYGSLYAGTVLLRADADVKPANAIWATSKHEAFTKYEQHIYLTRTVRVGSNVLEEKEVTGKVESVVQIVTDGNTDYLIRLVGHPNDLWNVKIGYIGDPSTEAALELKPGNTVRMKYGDSVNRRTYFTREISLVSETDTE